MAAIGRRADIERQTGLSALAKLWHSILALWQQPAAAMEPAAVLAGFEQACRGLHVSVGRASPQEEHQFVSSAPQSRLAQRRHCRHPPQCTAAAAAGSSSWQNLLHPFCNCSPVLLPQVQDAATRSQAEQALLEFRRSGSVEACAAVLQQSADEAVRFQVGSLLCLLCMHA